MTGSGIFAPGFKASPFWWEAAAPTVLETPSLPEATEVAIVGGGYAGLSAALELRRQGVDCTVFEAEALGYGASSRNGGMVSAGINLAKGKELAETLGPERAQALLDEASASYTHLETLIEREGIDCDYRRSGRFVGAHSRRHYAELERRAERIARTTNQRIEMVPEAHQREEIASDYYRGGMLVYRAGGLHPGKFHQGLVAACERAGARLLSKTPVSALAGSRGGFTLTTPSGAVRAREIVIATNGYTGKLTPWFRRRLIPVASYIIATEALDADRAQALIPRGRVIADTKRVLYYYRLSPDGRRVLFGGRASFRSVDAVSAAPRLHGYMLGVFPQLAGTRISHAWNGNVAFTFDMLPHMGIAEGMHYCMGCNGSGVVMNTHLGHQVALKILGTSNQASAFDGLKFPSNLLYRGRPWFLPLVGSWYRLRDRIDRWLD
ncbi:MAG: FAD-binding oxidoreductase [Proteobacteria bacterium]|nr:FAD-binding oxidoreductase [Pseudomonadota bacterium]MBI3496867.1 FAD-binding oxidoreductase [Pseudomonadota bacterium]